MHANILISFMFLALGLPSACGGQKNHKPLMGGIQSREQQQKQTAAASDPCLPAPLRDRPEQILRREGYVASYNRDLRICNWVAWHLTKTHSSGPYKRKGISFREDTEVAQPRPQNSDYARSGYDRGHMCPSGDNQWSQKAQEDCFLFTNMCPQSHDLNSGDWNDLESKCRDWAWRYGDIYIVAGPVLRGSRHRKIGRNRVTVPEAFYKVVLCMKGQPRALGFLYENEDGHRKMSSYVKTVDEIEALTGIDFFASLPEDVEQAVERRSDFLAW